MVRRMRKVVRYILLCIAAAFVAMFAKPFFSELLRRAGIDTAQWAGPVIAAASSLISQEWFRLLGVAAIGTAVGLWLDTFLRWLGGNGATVYAPFQAAYDMAKGIGPPIGRPIGGGVAAWHEYDRAACIWLKRTHKIYALPFVPGRTPFYVQDPGSLRFHDPDHVRKILNLDADRSPPLGGIAAGWAREPSAWSWMGDLKWRKVVAGRDLIVQHFEGGFIAGYSRETPSEPKRVLFGSWSVRIRVRSRPIPLVCEAYRRSTSQIKEL